MLLATAACNFSTSQLQKVARDRQFFSILTCKCASRCSGAQFSDIATSKPRGVLYQNALLATAACNFSTSQLQKWSKNAVFCNFKMCFSLQRRAIFYFSAQQLPPHPPLYRGYFSTQPTHKSLLKNKAFRDFPNISRLWIFFRLTFAQLYLLSSGSTSLLCFFIF